MTDSSVPFESRGTKSNLFLRGFLVVGTISLALGSMALSWLLMGTAKDGDTATKPDAIHASQGTTKESGNSRQRLSTLPPALSMFIDPTVRLSERMRIAESGSLLGLTRTDEKAALLSVLRNPLDAAPARNQAANALRSLGYEQLPSELIRLLGSHQEKPDFRGWLTQHIGIAWQQAVATDKTDTATTCEQSLLTALTDRDDTVKREAFLALGRGRHPASDAMIHDAMTDDAKRSLIDVAIRLIQERDDRAWAARLREIAGRQQYGDASRILAIHTLTKWQDAPSRITLASIKASASEADSVKRAAAQGVAGIGNSFTDALPSGVR
jgi:hypothetical protein